MASNLLSWFVSLLSSITAFLAAEPMIYLVTCIIGLFVIKMFRVLICPSKDI